MFTWLLHKYMARARRRESERRAIAEIIQSFQHHDTTTKEA